MKILIDNNVILDAFLARKTFNTAAEQIMSACADVQKGCISTNSLTDIFYVLRKSLDTTTAKAVIRKMMNLFEIITVNEDDCRKALSLNIDDFEDALVVVCARKAGADFIVTRDEKFLKTVSPAAIISPDRLLEKLI